jgi:hypothetical protein
MSTPITPFWFKQRQCKAEPAGEHLLKATGPNLGEAYLHVQRDNDHWKASLRLQADGPDVVTAQAAHPTEHAAWDAAFELYREQVIV